MTAPMRLGVMRSPRKNGASRMVQAGMVNSSANTVASGNSSTLHAQRYCEPKWMLLRNRCRPKRLVLTACRSSGRTAMIASTIRIPTAARIVSISTTLNDPDSPRIAIAMTENDSSVPVIQATTTRSWRGEVTSVPIPSFVCLRGIH